jgi:hypothetical protein
MMEGDQISGGLERSDRDPAITLRASPTCAASPSHLEQNIPGKVKRTLAGWSVATGTLLPR